MNSNARRSSEPESCKRAASLEVRIEDAYLDLVECTATSNTLWMNTVDHSLEWSPEPLVGFVEVGTYTSHVHLEDLRSDVFHEFEALAGRKHARQPG